jgi:ABC-2 type transport system ATP-binding protein
MRVLQTYGRGDVHVNAEHRHLAISVGHGSKVLADVVRDLDEANVPVDDLALRRPTLDDVFLALTGHGAEVESAPSEERGRFRRPRREDKEDVA